MAECCHGGQISVFSALSNVQLACNGEWIAAPYKDKSFAVWKHGNLNANVRSVVKKRNRFCSVNNALLWAFKFLIVDIYKQHKLKRYKIICTL